MAESSPITSRPPRAAITRELVQPPARVYLTLTDRLYIRSRNSLAGVVLRVAGRLLLADGTISPFAFTHTPATDRSASLESFQLAEGYLLSAVVFPTSGTPRRGQTFVEIGFLRGKTTTAAAVDVLAKDYVAVAEPLAFPGSPIHSSLEGSGAIRSITGTDPAAGVEVSEAVPTDARWRVLTVLWELVADATVANRQPQLQLTDGATVLSKTRALTAQTASQTRIYNYSLNYPDNTPSQTAGEYQSFLPINMLAAGFIISSDTTSLQAGDNYGAPQLLVEEWLED